MAALSLLGACAGANVQPTASPALGPARAGAGPVLGDDSALALAMRLPVGADRCSIARPYRIDDRQKALAKQVMQTDALAWDPELAITAFASADYGRDDGPSAHVMWLRSALPLAELQKRIDTRLAIEWNARERCVAAPCPLRGEIIDGAMRLSGEPWPVGLPAGAEALASARGRPARARAVRRAAAAHAARRATRFTAAQHDTGVARERCAGVGAGRDHGRPSRGGRSCDARAQRRVRAGRERGARRARGRARAHHRALSLGRSRDAHG